MPIRQSDPFASSPAPAASPVHGGASAQVAGLGAGHPGTGQTPRTGQRETFAADELAKATREGRSTMELAL